MIVECRGKTYDKRLELLRLTTLENRRFRADMLELFKILKGFEGISADSFFRVLLELVHSDFLIQVSGFPSGFVWR
jgi:hypothetical protein